MSTSKTKLRLDTNVFDESLNRFKWLYEEGHRVVVSFSGGKDSGVCLELCIIAAKETGNLPVETVIQDDNGGSSNLTGTRSQNQKG